MALPAGADPGAIRSALQLTLTGDADLPPPRRQTVEDVCLITVGDPAGLVLRLVAGPGGRRPARAGERGRITIEIGTDCRADLALRAHLISPWGTWEWIGPAAVGAVLPASGQVRLDFDVTRRHRPDPAMVGAGPGGRRRRIALLTGRAGDRPMTRRTAWPGSAGSP